MEELGAGAGQVWRSQSRCGSAKEELRVGVEKLGAGVE